MKCKNCGREIKLMFSGEIMEYFHTGVENNTLPSRYCDMMEIDGRPIDASRVAEPDGGEDVEGD